MASVSRVKFSGTTDYKQIKIAATATPGTTIHTAAASPTLDEIWLWATNPDTVDYDLTIEFGGTTAPDDTIKITIPAKSGEIPVLRGRILTNSLVLKAFGSTANKIMVGGHVNRIA